MAMPRLRFVEPIGHILLIVWICRAISFNRLSQRLKLLDDLKLQQPARLLPNACCSSVERKADFKGILRTETVSGAKAAKVTLCPAHRFV